MGLVALELERVGIATVALQLLHAAAEQTRPPRALWAPFWRGYALGDPKEPGEARAVLEAALAMLEDSSLRPPAFREFHAGD